MRLSPPNVNVKSLSDNIEDTQTPPCLSNERVLVLLAQPPMSSTFLELFDALCMMLRNNSINALKQRLAKPATMAELQTCLPISGIMALLSRRTNLTH
jgi:hypothetical protein